MAVLGSALAAIAVGYLLATSYLVLRDDLIGATAARQARMQQAYEDRISALRAQVDRITSRQLLDQQLMQSKVGELLERQTKLTQRHGRLGPVLDRIEGGPELPGQAPLPAARPELRASLGFDGELTQEFALAGVGQAADQPFAFWSARSSSDGTSSAADEADRLFASIGQSLRAIETEQLTRIETLAEDAYQTAEVIADPRQGAGLTDRERGDADALRADGCPFVNRDSNSFPVARRVG